jgi:hypothetical protein
MYEQSMLVCLMDMLYAFCAMNKKTDMLYAFCAMNKKTDTLYAFCAMNKKTEAPHTWKTRHNV